MAKEPQNSDIRQTAAYKKALSFLFGRINYERVKKMPYSKRDLNIRRMQRLLQLLDEPHDKLRIIHIAGTKGKGSTTAFLSAAFVAAGFRCGSYTSPHLKDIEERFRIDGRPCSPEMLIELIDAVRPAVETMDQGEHQDQPTYFEVCTAIAFLLFLKEDVQIAILEVGLGGRLDSTNVCSPLVSVITSISFDHMKQLGNTLREIATEKAGIIKPGVPVVNGATDDEAVEAIHGIASEKGCELFQLSDDFTCSYSPPQPNELGIAHFEAGKRLDSKKLHEVPLGLVGTHQATNAAIAWATMQVLPEELRVPDDAIRQGFEQARCEARIEVVAHSPEVIVDSSHNVASAAALVNVLTTVYTDRHRVLVLGATTGKDIDGMLEVFLPAFDQVVCTQYDNNPRAVPAQTLFELAQRIEHSADLICEPDKRKAWQLVVDSASADHVLCVTGSFFIAAEIKELIEKSD